jgi:hypothetical protein
VVAAAAEEKEEAVNPKPLTRPNPPLHHRYLLQMLSALPVSLPAVWKPFQPPILEVAALGGKNRFHWLVPAHFLSWKRTLE